MITKEIDMADESAVKEQEILPPAPEDTANDDERTLLDKFIDAKFRAENLAVRLAEVSKERDDIESKLIALLEDDDKKASARYAGVGHVTIIEGAAFASIEKGRQEDVLAYLKTLGREDMIKTTVHSATLSVFVRECLKRNDSLPPGVTFYKPKGLRFYPEK